MHAMAAEPRQIDTAIQQMVRELQRLSTACLATPGLKLRFDGD
ncbi:hypothetical protein [Nonomuraea dietziae]